MAFESLLRNPTAFLSKSSSNNVKDLLSTLKERYDDLKGFQIKKSSKEIKKLPKSKLRSSSTSNPLPSLLVDGFDAEQVWQQIELQNKDFRRNFVIKNGDLPSTSQADNEEGEDDDVSDHEGDEFEQEGDEDFEDGEGEGEGIEEEMDQEEKPDEDGEQEKSAFEQQQKKLKKRIEEYEEQILSDKPWQLSGEVTASRRPENSLLEEHLFYDHATKLPPVITQETTESLESLIQQRIRDQAWDDVERKIKPISTPYVYKNELILDQEKSKMSLAQVYEQEFLKKTIVTDEEKKNPKHEEIRKGMKELFFKLDLLTSSHYAPRPMMPELKVVNNMQSIRMEEVAPVSVSDAALLAPEEVKERRAGEVKAKEERSRVDKNRELRSKKKKQSLKAAKQQKDESKKASTKTPKDKMKMLRKVGRIRRVETGAAMDNAKGTTSSNEFFSRLQKQVTNSMASGASDKKKKNDNSKKSGASYKT